MSSAQILEIGKDLLLTTLLLAGPALVVSLIVGLIISIFQTITSIQEQTLSFVPRLLAVGLVLILTMAWALDLASHFTYRMFQHAAEAIK